MKATLLMSVGAMFAVARASGGTIIVDFGPAPGVTPDYTELHVEIGDLRKEGGWKNATKRFTREPRFKESFSFPTGTYLVRVFTGPAEEMTRARPGAYYTNPLFARLTNDSSAEKFVFEYRPLDLESLKGNATRVAEVLESDGKPASGVEFDVSALFRHNPNEYDRPYLLGRHRTGPDGMLRLEGMAPGRRLTLTDTNGVTRGNMEGTEVLVITLPPRVGVAAPDFAFTDINSGKEHRLSELRGKIVVLDFWATWCAPCQKGMAELQTLNEKRPQWGDRVKILTLSIDATVEKARTHLKKNGWTRTENGWAGPGEWNSAAVKAYSVASIPNTWVVDAEGKIAGSGSGMFDPAAIVDKLLK